MAAYLDGIAIINQEHQVVEANERFAEMLGYTPKEILNLHTWDWDAVMTETEIRTNFMDITKTNTVFETRHRRKDGTIFDVEVSASGTKVGDEALVFTINRDITERKRVEEELRKHREHLEELVEERTAELIKSNQKLQQEIIERKRVEIELQQAKEAAEAANRLKSEFLANMSHDIRTPLNAVLGFAEILKERLRGFPQYQDYLNRIMDGGRTLLHLIDDILDLSRIEVGRLDIRPETVNLPAVLTEIQHMFSSKARAKGIDLSLYISPDSPTTVLLDGNRLRQILVNLVGNAIKFTENGSVTLEVTNVTNVEDNELQSSMVTLQFSIGDTGIGIPEEDQERIFEAFQQHDPRSSGGTGLGLAITKRLVELMHGTITVESAVNKGTLFRVLLPATGIAVHEEEGSAREPREHTQFHGATVLLAEDNASSRDVVRAYVAPHDLRLIEAENGQEALQMLKHFHPDLILMDIHMPVMDGYTAAQKIRNLKSEIRNLPIVALTAYAIKEQKEKYQDLYDAYLIKPISKTELLATLAEFLPHTKTALKEENPTPGSSQEENAGKMPVSPGSSMFEDLKNYAAQTGTFPQALLNKLQIELLPRHKEISELMSMDGMIEFAKAVIVVGDAFTIPPLKYYGEELLHYIKVFDVINMKRLLALFPEIVEIING
jgi:PAS domain S-box-containing protein